MVRRRCCSSPVRRTTFAELDRKESAGPRLPNQLKYNIRPCRYVALNYVDAASLAFGTRTFTLAEFSSRMGSLRAARLLSEMKIRGHVERTGRGLYRILPPDERLDFRANEWERVNRILLDSELPMAWTDADAVRMWTGGRYTVSPSAYLKEFHIEVPDVSLGDWRAYLRARRVSTDPRRRIGSKVVITRTRTFRHSVHRGEPVISRRRTLAMIKNHRGLYANADELLED